MLRNVQFYDKSSGHMKRLIIQYGQWRKHFSDLSNVIEFIESGLRTSGCVHGYRWMHLKCLSNGLIVTRENVREILRELDPLGVEMRSHRLLQRKTYSSKGQNYMCHIDGYDKLKGYGLPIHGCVGGFSRKVIWRRVCYINNDPSVVAGFISKQWNPLELVRIEYARIWGLEMSWLRQCRGRCKMMSPIAFSTGQITITRELNRGGAFCGGNTHRFGWMICVTWRKINISLVHMLKKNRFVFASLR